MTVIHKIIQTFLPECACGQSNDPKISPRVVNGFTAAKHQVRCSEINCVISKLVYVHFKFPWQVEIQVADSRPYPHVKHDNVCGAALISKHWVITARHCFNLPQDARGVFPSMFWVYAQNFLFFCPDDVINGFKSRFSLKPIP